MTINKAIATAPGQSTQNVPLSPADLIQKDIDGAATAASVVPNLLSKVKLQAGSRILSIAPEWKQRNMIARAVQLVEINGNRTPAEQAELDQYQAIWDKVSAIRLYSDSLEGQVNAAEDPLSVDIETGWPT